MIIQAGLDLLNIVALKNKYTSLSEGYKLKNLGLPLLLHLGQHCLETGLLISFLADLCELIQAAGDIKLFQQAQSQLSATGFGPNDALDVTPMPWSECWVAQDIDDGQLRAKLVDLRVLRLEDFQGLLSMLRKNVTITESYLEALDRLAAFLDHLVNLVWVNLRERAVQPLLLLLLDLVNSCAQLVEGSEPLLQLAEALKFACAS